MNNNPIKYYDGLWRVSAGSENRLERARREMIVGAIARMGRKELSILDLGCGRGLLVPHLAVYGAITGIDWSKEAILSCQKICPQGHFLCGSVFEVELPMEQFDVVVSQEVIEHFLPDGQIKYLQLVHQWLAPGGVFLLTTPNKPVVIRANAEHITKHGKPWSNQPIENWLTKYEIEAKVTAVGIEIIRSETFIFGFGQRGIVKLLGTFWRLRHFRSWIARRFDAGLHIFLEGTKTRPCETGMDGRI